MKADYPLRFIGSIVNEFQKDKECGDESFIILPNLFEITKPFISTEISYCEFNEIKPTLRCLINGEGGPLLIFRFFSDPPELIRTPRLLIFME